MRSEGKKIRDLCWVTRKCYHMHKIPEWNAAWRQNERKYGMIRPETSSGFAENGRERIRRGTRAHVQRAAVWFLVAALLSSHMAGTVCMAAENGEEAGTQEQGEEVRIASVEDFLEFAQGCREDWYSYGKDFYLEADLDLTGTSFEGIAYLNGTFHGNSHRISGVLLDGKGSDYGFFRYVGIYGSVEDLRVEGRIEKEGTGENIGGIAGVNFGLISGCTFRGEVKGEEAAGGIAGYNKADGRIVGCTVTGRVVAVNRTGGICGENKGTIQDCVNESTVNGEDLEATLNLDGVDLGQLNLTQNVVTRNDSGGIAGLSGGTITGCTNRGTIGYAHVGYNVGGIAGRHDGTVIECRNEGTILGRKDVGGIVGQAEPYRESEYLSDRLEKLQDDLGRMNGLVVQMSDALSQTSSEASAYTKTLQQQYEDTVDSLNREVNYLRDSISEDREETRGYIDSISQALENMSEIGNDTVNRVMDQVNSTISDVNRTVNDVREEVKDRIDQEMDKIDKDKIELPDLKPGGDKDDDGKEDGGKDPSDGSGTGEGGNGSSGSGSTGGGNGSSGSGSTGGGNGSSGSGSSSEGNGSSGSGSSDGGNGSSGSGSSSEGNGSSGSGSSDGGNGSSGSGSSDEGNGGSDSSNGGGSPSDEGSSGSGSSDGGSGGSAERGSGSSEGESGMDEAFGNAGSPYIPYGRKDRGEDMQAGAGTSSGVPMRGGVLYADEDVRPTVDMVRKGGHGAENAGMMPVSRRPEANSALPGDEPEVLYCTTSKGDGGASSGDGGASSGSGDSSSEGEPPEESIDPSLPDLDIDKDKVEEGLKKAGEGFTRKDYIRTEPDPEIKNNLNKMKDEISGISSNVRGMYDSISSGEESVGDAAGNISNELTDQSKLSGDTIDELADSVDNGIQSMTSSLNGLMSTQQRIRDSVGEDLDILMGNEEADLDISSENIEKRTQGVITGCVNYGEVLADLNLGGIAGIMNVEYDISPEMDLDLTGLTDVTVRSTTYNVLIHCVNYGKVTAKKNYCGGVVGNEQLGLVYDCENYGSVRTENGSRAGGIAGLSTSSIQNSYAFCNISGTDYLGGISGDGYDIGGCAAMCRIESDGGEYIGSIAGHVDEEAVVSGNFFTSDRWEGLDDISYFGRAQGCTYEELMQMGMPEGFTMVTVTFELDEKEIGTIRIPYGGSVEEEDVPDPALESGYLSWGREFPIRGVTENITVEAQEKDWVTSLASKETDDQEKALFLVEGSFYGDASLELAQCPQEKEGAAYAYGWSVTGEGPGENTYIGHFLIPEGADDAEVWLLSEGAWRRSRTERDGNYVTASIAPGECFAVCPVEEDKTVYLLAGCAALAAALLIVCAVAGRKRKKRHTTGKEE